MTQDRNFKKLVRARMAETGENYTAARATLITEREAAERFHSKIVRTFFRNSRLVGIPAKRKARVIVLIELLSRFDSGRDYREIEVNEILGALHPDFAYLRRELIGYGFMTREAGIYRVVESLPAQGHTVAPEMLTAHSRRG